VSQVVPDDIRDAIQAVCTTVGVVAVDVRVRGQLAQLLLEIHIDARGGVSHDECSAVSRGLDDLLEEHPWYGRLRSVEVSSPGVDAPLRELWQLDKHVGRTLRVVRSDDSTIKGDLAAVTDEGLRLTVVAGKGKQRTGTDVEIALGEFREATVVLRF
jgi:ribosome maturation factor RimP